MPGIYDLIEAMMGRPDPVAQLAAGRGPQPLPQPAVGGGAPPPPTGAPPASPGPDGAPQGASAQAPPPQQQQQPPQPQAYQSPQDMQQMYAQLMQRQQGSDMFNRGMANFVAGFSPLSQRASIASNFDRGPDAGEVMGNIMKAQMWNQQQQQHQAFVQSAPDVAKMLGPNVTPQEVLAWGPEATSQAIKLGMPPDQLRQYLGFKQQFIHDHATDPGPDGVTPLGPDGAGKLFEQQNPMSVAMAGVTGAGADPIDSQRLLERARWASDPNNKGKPVPAYYGDRASFVARGQQVEQQTADRGKAVQNFGDLNATLAPIADTLGDVANDQALPTLVGKPLNTFVPLIPGSANDALNTKLQNLQKQTAAAAAKGGPGTAGTLTQAAINAGDLTKYSTPVEDYRSSVLQPMMKQTLTAMANNYGASGQTDNMPAYLRSYLSKVYQPGGELYVGSGSYKQAPPTAQGKTPITPEMMPHIQEGLERDGPTKTLANLRKANYDTSSLE